MAFRIFRIAVGVVLGALALSLIVSAVQAAGSKLIVSWGSTNHRLYDLERCTNLKSGQYEVVGSNLSATPPFNTFTDTVAGISATFTCGTAGWVADPLAGAAKSATVIAAES